MVNVRELILFFRKACWPINISVDGNETACSWLLLKALLPIKITPLGRSSEESELYEKAETPIKKGYPKFSGGSEKMKIKLGALFSDSKVGG